MIDLTSSSVYLGEKVVSENEYRSAILDASPAEEGKGRRQRAAVRLHG